MPPNPLSSPVGALMRPTLHVNVEDSMAMAAVRFRQNGGAVLPVLRGDRLAGIVDEAVLGRSIAEANELTDAVEGVMATAETIHPYESGAEALRRGPSTLVVVDDTDQVLGLISPSDLWPRPRMAMRPASVGGMATPFGVYLTAGTVRAGASGWAMMSTGSSMFLMMFVGYLATAGTVYFAAHHGVSEFWIAQLFGLLPLLIFLALMRLLPLSGTHGAEHQVVHAIERGEELVPDVVRRMPRVHPRCGTNYGTAMGLFLSLFTWEWTPYEGIRLLVAVVATAMVWRPLGYWLQQHVTTKRPSDKQLAAGIRAGEALLEKYAVAPVAQANPLQRLVQSGMPFVLAGSVLTGIVVGALLVAFRLDIGL